MGAPRLEQASILSDTRQIRTLPSNNMSWGPSGSHSSNAGPRMPEPKVLTCRRIKGRSQCADLQPSFGGKRGSLGVRLVFDQRNEARSVHGMVGHPGCRELPQQGVRNASPTSTNADIPSNCTVGCHASPGLALI